MTGHETRQFVTRIPARAGGFAGQDEASIVLSASAGNADEALGLRVIPGTQLIDGMAVRGGASAVVRTGPGTGVFKTAAQAPGADTRGAKRIYRDLVSVYAPKS